MKWRDHFYVDLALPFSLCSAPFIFNNVAVMLECILRNNYGIQAFASDFAFLLPPKNALGPTRASYSWRSSWIRSSYARSYPVIN